MDVHDIYTDHKVLTYAESNHLPVVKELERRARAWCLSTGMQYDPSHILVAQLSTGNIAILTKIGSWKKKGRRRVRGPGSRWKPNFILVYESIVCIEWQVGTEFDTGTNQVRLINKSRFVATIPELVVSDKELAKP